MLHGVAQQVGQREHETAAIASDAGCLAGVRVDGRTTEPRLHGHQLDGTIHHLRPAHDLESHPIVGILETAELGERRDHADHHLGARCDPLDGHRRALRQRAEHSCGEQLTVAVGDGERPAELVHGDGERGALGR